MAINAVFRLITFSLLIATNLCNDGLQTTQRYEAIVTIPDSLSTQNSLDRYSSESNCRRRLLSSDDKPELLLISTLDGKLSALDVTSGEELWSKPLSSEPLISSTISNFEIIRKGRIVRVVPSLDGNLYLFDGQTIDEIPLNADILLKSSFKLGDDLVITGGQESHISGVEISSGRVHYECGINGCPSAQINENETFDDLFLVKSNRQTVRAIDPKSGRQKWHFSVTEPEISEAISAECGETDDIENPNTITDNSVKETDFQVIVPNGVISAKRHASGDSKGFQWSHRFSSPIVQVWHYRKGRIDSMNLFDKRKLFGLTNTELQGYEPTIYIGLFRNQWYVQSSEALKVKFPDFEVTNNMLASETRKRLDSQSKNVLQIEWKPMDVNLIDDRKYLNEEKLKFVSSPQFSLAISSKFDQDIGYYILDAMEENETKCMARERNFSSFEDWEEQEETVYEQTIVVVTSLWHYWREVLGISICSAIGLNFVYSFIKRKIRKKVEEIERMMSKSDSLSKGSASTSPETTPLPLDSNPLESNYFSSRYESDFDPIQVLGKGGFGVVFEAKHKIDESHYAVKRICLPVRKERKEKVMREVRALSKLDHSGIVRYYNAWVELPPPGWQETKDKHLLPEDMTKSNFNESLLSSPNHKPFVNKLVAIDEFKSTDSSVDFSFGYSNKLSKFNETKSDQSLDIVFEEDVSSIKMIEANECQIRVTSRDVSTVSIASNLTSDRIQSLSSTTSTNHNNNSVKSGGDRSLSLMTNASIPRCYLYIQMQLCRKDTLKDWLFANSKHRDKTTVLDIFDQIVSAVHYVHSMGLMHRDLKPSNIFFSMDGNIKIGDFGLVTATAADEEVHTPGTDVDCDDANTSVLNQSSSSHTNCVGTQLYMSPEQVKNMPYSQKVDIFSMGIILFELLIPFNTETERYLLLNNARKRIFPKDFSDEYVLECDLLKKLLAHNPDKRPTTLEIKDHELLQQIQSTASVPRQRSRTISLNSDDFTELSARRD